MVGEAAVPCTRRLFKPIERLTETTHIVGLGDVDEPRRLYTIYHLGEITM
jgi:hypothetical protein